MCDLESGRRIYLPKHRTWALCNDEKKKGAGKIKGIRDKEHVGAFLSTQLKEEGLATDLDETKKNKAK